MDHTNYFARFERKDKSQEDPLTRAFLALLRLVPPVQSMFVDAVRASQAERGAETQVPPRSQGDMSLVRTQVGNLLTDAGRVVSILIINEPWEHAFTVTDSTRSHVYDGLIHYADEWIFVLENKPFGGVRRHQLHPNTGGKDTLIVEPTLVVLVWKDLIKRLHMLTEIGALSTTQEHLVSDFIDYVQVEFPDLNPYPTFAACRDHHSLLQKRCEDVLRELNRAHVDRLKGWKTHLEVPDMKSARMVALYIPKDEEDEDWVVEASIHPANTVGQARPFYKRVDVKAFIALRNEGWEVTPNLHFSHIRQNLVYARDASPPLDAYLQYWRDRPGQIGKIEESKFDEKLDTFQAEGFVTDADRAKFKKKFHDTNRSRAFVRPGVSLRYQWTKAEAEALDESGDFAGAVAEQVRLAAQTWSEADVWDALLAERDDTPLA